MNIKIRLATMDDAKILYEWANDPTVRNASFNQSPIQYEKHVTWLRGKLKDSNAKVLIALSDEKPIGVVRFDIIESRALISITLGKTARGNKFGTQTLSAAISYALRTNFCKEFIAYIKEQNIPSQKIFINNNFLQVNNTEPDKYPGLKFLLIKNRDNYNNLAIIPARGGSKRIPRKNIKPFLGLPIIKYSIDAALQSKCFDEVMVSTDDKEIAELSIIYGAKVPFFRSAINSDDHSTTVDVLIEVVSNYQSQTEMEFSHICCIYPTAPFVTSEKLVTCMNLLKEKNADSVVPITRFGYPIQRSLTIENGFLKMNWPENYNIRSQDLSPTYHDCGQFYCIKVKSFIEQRRLFGEQSIPVIIPESEVQDIDNEEDWKLAEVKYTLLKGIRLE